MWFKPATAWEHLHDDESDDSTLKPVLRSFRRKKGDTAAPTSAETDAAEAAETGADASPDGDPKADGDAAAVSVYVPRHLRETSTPWNRRLRLAAITVVAGGGLFAASVVFAPPKEVPAASPDVTTFESESVDDARDIPRVLPESAPDGTPSASAVPVLKTMEPVETTAPTSAADPSAPGGSTNTTPPVVAALAQVTSIPEPALVAYLAAEQWAAQEFPSCHIEWELLAAFGFVESKHGQHAGSSVGADGIVSPPIYGPPTAYGRAVGPMQFLESTWRKFGMGGNPQNFGDAARAAAKYLCYGGRDLATDSGRRTAAFSYNHADWYVAKVISAYEQYLEGHTVTPAPDDNTDHSSDGSERDNGSGYTDLPDVEPSTTAPVPTDSSSSSPSDGPSDGSSSDSPSDGSPTDGSPSDGSPSDGSPTDGSSESPSPTSPAPTENAPEPTTESEPTTAAPTS